MGRSRQAAENAPQLTHPGGRLTLVSGTPVMTTTQTAKTNIYYTPYVSNFVPVYNGTSWDVLLFSELTLALDSNSGHTGYHQNGKNFDLFVVNDSGTIRLVSGPAWTSDTARSAAISITNGFYSNTSSMTAKFDSSASTLTVAAGRGTYVGTFRAWNADGNTGFQFASALNYTVFYLWNMYNRVFMTSTGTDSTDSWTYSTSTWREANAGTGSNGAYFLRGLDDESVIMSYKTTADVTIGTSYNWTVALDSTTAPSGGDMTSAYNAAGTGRGSGPALYIGRPGLGWHYLIGLEWASGASATIYGDGGTAANLHTTHRFGGWF